MAPSKSASQQQPHQNLAPRQNPPPPSLTHSRKGGADDGACHFGTPFENVVAATSLFRSVTPCGDRADAVTHAISLVEKAIV
jgi:hypothetical protein